MKTERLSVIISVDKYAWRVTTSMMTFAVLTAVGWETGLENSYREYTYITVLMFS